MGQCAPRKSLKSVLLDHQKRQTHISQQAAKRAATEAKIKQSNRAEKSGTSKKRKKVAIAQNAVIPFHATDKILLIGEGNFSFAHSLLNHPSIPSLPPANITATAYDTEAGTISKYPDAKQYISALRLAGAAVIFNVDASRLDKIFPPKTSKKWDKVVWNFPHVGLSIADRDRNIVANQRALLGFLASVAPYLEEGIVPDAKAKGKANTRVGGNEDISEDEDVSGEMSARGNEPKWAGSVLITLREQEPYTLWNLPRLAKDPVVVTIPRNVLPQPRYIQVRSFAFHAGSYPGYEHRRTSGWNERERPLVGSSHAQGDDHHGQGQCRTWEFVLRPEWFSEA